MAEMQMKIETSDISCSNTEEMSTGELSRPGVSMTAVGFPVYRNAETDNQRRLLLATEFLEERLALPLS
jgi:hypothetical protein